MPRPRDAELTAKRRKQILTATHRLFTRRRFDQITFQAVAREADLSKGAVLHYFPTKEDLYTALQEGLALYQEQRLEEALARSGDPWQKLNACVEAAFHGPRENHEYFGVFLDFLTQARSDSAFEKFNRHIFALCEDRITRIVEEGQRQGVFRKDVWPRDVGVMWRALVDGLNLRWVLEARPQSARGFSRYREIAREALRARLEPESASRRENAAGNGRRPRSASDGRRSNGRKSGSARRSLGRLHQLVPLALIALLACSGGEQGAEETQEGESGMSAAEVARAPLFTEMKTIVRDVRTAQEQAAAMSGGYVGWDELRSDYMNREIRPGFEVRLYDVSATGYRLEIVHTSSGLGCFLEVGPTVRDNGPTCE